MPDTLRPEGSAFLFVEKAEAQRALVPQLVHGRPGLEGISIALILRRGDAEVMGCVARGRHSNQAIEVAERGHKCWGGMR